MGTTMLYGSGTVERASKSPTTAEGSEMKFIKLTRYKKQFEKSAWVITPNGYIYIALDHIEAIIDGTEKGSTIWIGGSHTDVLESPEEIMKKVEEAQK